jgi:hypothetical protein
MDGGAGQTLDQRDFYPTSLQMNESCEAGSNGGVGHPLDQRYVNPINIVADE